MAKIEMPQIDDLRKKLEYDADTGFLFWRERSPADFADADPVTRCRQWNTRFAGKRALATIGKNGYLFGTFYGKPFTAHRIILAMVNGYWPRVTDHINGDRLDNRFVNLRDVSDLENVKNRRLQKRNVSGAHGVQKDKRNGRWVVRVGAEYSYKWIGQFADLEDAKAARLKAQEEMGFHPNHGK